MNILALETSSARGAVALQHAGQVREALIATPREQHERLLPLVQQLLREAQVQLAQLDAIAFGRGPGSFTGLRIAAAAAQGLALGADLPLLPVSSLAALAQGAWREHGAERSLVCVDARMGEVYWAAFEVRAGLATALGEERIGRPQDVAAPAAASWAAVGDGFSAHEAVLGSVLAAAAEIFTHRLPAARDLLPAASHALKAGHGLPPEQALPSYLRGEHAWRRLPGEEVEPGRDAKERKQ